MKQQRLYRTCPHHFKFVQERISGLGYVKNLPESTGFPDFPDDNDSFTFAGTKYPYTCRHHRLLESLNVVPTLSTHCQQLSQIS